MQAVRMDSKLLCNPCKGKSEANSYCIECQEYMCIDCASSHEKMKAKKQHKFVAAETAKDHEIKNEDEKAVRMDSKLFCEPCEGKSEANSYCIECQEYMCIDCASSHKKMKATKQHKLVAAETAKDHEIKNKGEKAVRMDSKLFCEPCEGKSEANSYCIECQEYMCIDCATSHEKMRATKQHKLVAAEKAKDHEIKNEDEKVSPGRPTSSTSLSDSITLIWDPPTKFGNGDNFRISYKNMNGDRKWKQFHEEYTSASATLSDLKSNAKYIFRVRVIHEDGDEGPYSEESEEIQTTTSLASRMLQFSTKVGESDTSPTKYVLPLTELVPARNNTAKTKKFEIGTRPIEYTESKTIMLVGATGTGKSTFVDGIINYVLGVTWDDSFRYTIIDLEDEEKDRMRNQALSQTEWITCYKVYPETGSRLNYQLQIIDTPGFGDTRGLKRDKEIVSQIRQLFSDPGPKGVTCIDAVCFLIKAPDARLTAVQSYIFQSIMSLFGKDIEDNICSLITFADGNDPPVLAALDESGLPFGKKFTFNNSALFAKNTTSESLSPMFWNIGLSSFRSFFIHLDQMRTKSLQLTKDVLFERYRLEAVIQTLKENLDAGLQMVEVLKDEKRVLEEHKSNMEAHKNYEIEVAEHRQIKTLIPGRVHNTKCENCYTKCHPNCIFDDDEKKQYCAVMDRTTGNCTVCEDHCHWRAHKNDAYKYEHVTVKVMKTLEELQNKYNDASGKVLTHKQTVDKNAEELKELTNNIEDMLLLIKHCNEKLKEIALRPNPLTVTEHIDLMIENEKMTKKEGYLLRIKVLNEFKKDAEVQKNVEVFRNAAIREIGEEQRPERPADSKSVLKRVTFWMRKHIPGFAI